MKRNFTLLLGVLLSTNVFGQFTSSNQPTVGDTKTYFLIDSNAVNLSNVTGNGVTWDYSLIWGYPGETRDLAVIDPTTTTNGSSFTGSTAALQLPTFTNYLATSASGRNSKGFVFTDPNAGDVIITFDTQDEQLMTYPFDLNSNLNGSYAGNFTALGNTSPCTGTSYSKVDGKGTLKLPAAGGSTVSLNNIYRHQLIDTTLASIDLFGTSIDVVIRREQYDYYDLASGNLPIFSHSKLTAKDITGTIVDITQNLVLSAFDPIYYLGVDKNKMTNINVYPNPATDVLNISGDYNNGTYVVMNVAGQTILSGELINGNQQINVSDLNAGVYFVKINSDKGESISKINVQ